MTQTLQGTIRGALVQNLPVPAGIDPARLVLWQQKGGYDYQQMRATLGAVLQKFNEDMVSVWGDLITVTPEQSVWYRNGGAIVPAEITMGNSRPTLVKGFNAGHMIDLKVWSLGVGGTSRELQDMTEAQLIGSVNDLATALRDQFDHDLLTRALTTTENLLGTSGYDVPFCNGSPNAGSSGPKYAPPKWNSTVFYEDHNHYIGVNSSTTTYDAGLSSVAKLIAEHGIAAIPFKAYVSEADITTIRGLTYYVQPVDDINHVDRGGLTSGNIYYEDGRIEGEIPQSGGRYIGAVDTAYGKVRCYATPRIPTGYAFMFRPGPAFAANNGLAMRYRPSTGIGVKINEIPDETTTFPIKEVDVELEYGISCGTNRYAGAAMQFGVGVVSYSNPTVAL